ncbi:enoyl-CoA-hydratase DpgB [Actinocorallia longicatena]|uniref:enoyl-CoA-hydratase DpgB n=1 Tax=Actinocorallia longicatena TaxID=111803 RepID=UPI0031DDF413
MRVDDDLTLRVDGGRPVSVAAVEAVQALCDRAEDHAGPAVVRLLLSGVPAAGARDGLTVGLVSKWERAVRRLERLAAVTVAAALGDVGGTALDVLLAADVRVAVPAARLVLPLEDGATWPGMTLYRLAQQAGPVAVRRAALLGEPVTAAEALALGLVGTLTEDTDAVFASVAAAAAGVSGSEAAIRRQLMFEAGTTSFEDALGAHLAACDRTLRRAEVR